MYAQSLEHSLSRARNLALPWLENPVVQVNTNDSF